MAPPVPNRIGPYTLIEEIGCGAMGRVYRARDQRSDTPVAIKTLRAGATPEDIYCLKREFRLARALSSRHLVPVYDLFVDGSRASLVMPLLSGQTFDVWAEDDEWRRQPPLLYRVLTGILAGVADLHRAGLLHCDIKPSNIMVEPGGDVMLLDYGLVTQRDRSDVFVTSSPGVLAGTLAYVSPEGIYGEAATPERDTFACGVSIFEALVGRLPPRRTDTWELMTERITPALMTAWAEAPAALVELVAAMLSNAPAARPKIEEAMNVVAALEDSAPPLSSTPPWHDVEDLIGRDDAIASVLEACTRGGRVAVLGPSGIGKSSLCRETLGRVRARHPDALVLAGRCHPGEHLPHRVFDEIIDALTRWLLRCGPNTLSSIRVPDLTVLRDAFRVLRSVHLGSDTMRPAPIGPEERRSRLATALADLLHAVHIHWPLVMWVDDVQWADDDAVPLLVEVLQWLPADGPTLLVSGHHLPKAYNNIASHTVELGPLPRAPCVAIASARAKRQGKDWSERDHAVLLDVATGNPGLLCHLVDYIGLRQHEEPPTLESLVERQLSAMTSEARLVAHAAALAGQPVPLEALLRLNSDDLRRAHHELENVGLLRRVPSRNHAAVEVAHERLRQAIVDRIDPDAKQSLHERLATVLETVELVPRELVAEQWALAGESARASQHFEDAGHRAIEALAFEHAVACYTRALALAPAARHHDLTPPLAHALALAGRGREAAATYREAALLAPFEQQGRLLQSAAIQLLLAGYVDDGMSAVRTVFRDLGIWLPASRLLTMLLIVLRRLWQRFVGIHYELREVATRPADDIADAAFAIGTALSPVDPALARYLQCVHLRHGLGSGDPFRIARALALEAGFEGSMGREPRATTALLSKARVVLGNRDAPQVEALFAIARAGIAWSSGAWRECIEAAKEAERIAEEELVGARWELNFARSVLLDAHRWTARYDELEALTRSYLEDAKRRGDRFARVTFRTRFETIAHLVGDRPRKAWNACNAAEQWTAEGVHLQDLAELHARSECLLYAGRVTDALAFAERRYRRVRWSLVMTVPAPRAKVFHQLGACRLARARHLQGGAQRHMLASARSAIRQVRAAPWAYTALLADLLQAGHDHLAGRDVRPALPSLIERALSSEMDHLAHAVGLAGALLDEDDEEQQRCERSLRGLGLKAPLKWTAVLLPGLVPSPTTIALTEETT